MERARTTCMRKCSRRSKYDQPGMGGERCLPSLPQGVATAGNWQPSYYYNNNFLVLHTYNDKGIKV
jgi:hypothetical protein